MCVVSASDKHVLALAALAMARRTWLVQRVRARIGRELRAILDPEDVLQDALVEGVVAARHNKLASEQALLAWVLAVARNRIAEIARQSRPRSRPRCHTSLPCALVSFGVPIDHEADEATGEALPSVVSRNELNERSQRLSALPAKQRLCVVLRDLMELPWESVAFAAGCSADAAQKLHQRARHRLAHVRC